MRPRKIAAIVGVIVIAVYVVWVAAATWFIRDGIYRVNDWQSEVTLSMGFAVSWWPGHLSGRDLRVVVHDTDAEIDMSFARFVLDVDTTALADHHFVTTTTRLDGVKFYLRSPRHLPALCATRGLPPITGQALPPPTAHCLEQSETLLAPTPPMDPKDIWVVDLANIELINVTDVWLDDYRLEGVGSVSNSRLYLWPSQRLAIEVPRSHWSAERVTVSDALIITHATADLTMTMDEVPTADNAKIWRAVSGNISVGDADGRLEHFASFAGHYHLAGEANVAHGVPQLITARGHVPDFAMDVGGKKLTGALEVHVGAAPGATEKTLHLVDSDLHLRDIAVDGKAFPGHELAASILPGGTFETSKRHFAFAVAAICNSNAPALALLPPGLGSEIAKILVKDGSPFSAAVRFSGPYDHLVASPFTARGGGLEVNGEIAIGDHVHGELIARFGPLSRTIHLD